MKCILQPSIICLIAALFFTSCEKEPELTPAEKLVGVWTITSSEIWRFTVTDGFSTLTFNECASSCSGADYSGEDETSGTFTYVLNDDASVLKIDDAELDGGSYDYS